MNAWLKYIDSNELQYIATPLTILDSGNEEDSEFAASFLYKDGLASPMAAGINEDLLKELTKQENKRRPPKKYWDQVKKEVYILLCTDHEKYIELRSHLENSKEKGTRALIAIIAGSVGSLLGVEAGLISGFCAIALNSVIKIGKEAYCSINHEKYA